MYLSIDCNELNKHKNIPQNKITNNEQVQIIRQKTTHTPVGLHFKNITNSIK